jgi:hypothetical protein
MPAHTPRALKLAQRSTVLTTRPVMRPCACPRRAGWILAKVLRAAADRPQPAARSPAPHSLHWTSCTSTMPRHHGLVHVCRTLARCHRSELSSRRRFGLRESNLTHHERQHNTRRARLTSGLGRSHPPLTVAVQKSKQMKLQLRQSQTWNLKIKLANCCRTQQMREC